MKESSTVQPALEQYDVGVIIGRFQVHRLHDAHRDLIAHVCENHDKVLILLGVAPLPTSLNNPLDFESRKQMILEEFPGVTVLYVKDQPSDKLWSRKVDEMVGDFRTPGQSAVLYGSRDSFIAHYHGTIPTRELIAENVLSGTAVRKEIAKSSARADEAFRAGVIWASQARYPTAFQTCDIAIIDDSTGRILLGRKPGEDKFRFIGGFSDPNSPSLEIDAKREAMEETGLAVEDVKYRFSAVVDDWRYRGEQDCIKTAMFTAKYVSGRPEAKDDIEEVRWFNLADLRENDVIPTHRPLLVKLVETLAKEA
jgi:bifunctional NMN adenylyltransferase/nudix hydrolase